MKTPTQQIEDLILELLTPSNNEGKYHTEDTLKRLCKRYHSMGMITQEYSDNALKRGKINPLPDSYKTMLEDDDWLIPYD